MADRDARTAAESDMDSPHGVAAEEFVRRARRQNVPELETLILFGSTARGTATGLDSDVDFLAIVSDSGSRAEIGDALREIAYDVMLEYGPVVEVHVLSRSQFERKEKSGHPFVRRALREGRTYD